MCFVLHREHQFKEVNSDCQGIYQGRVSTQEKTVASCQQQLPESELSLQVSELTSEIDLPLALFSTWILKVTLGLKGDVRRVGRSESPSVCPLLRARIIRPSIHTFSSACAKSWLQSSWQWYLQCSCPRNWGRSIYLKDPVLYSIQVILSCDGDKGSLSHDLSISFEKTAGSSCRWN